MKITENHEKIETTDAKILRNVSEIQRGTRLPPLLMLIIQVLIKTPRSKAKNLKRRQRLAEA